MQDEVVRERIGVCGRTGGRAHGGERGERAVAYSSLPRSRGAERVGDPLISLVSIISIGYPVTRGADQIGDRYAPGMRRCAILCLGREIIGVQSCFVVDFAYARWDF